MLVSIKDILLHPKKYYNLFMMDRTLQGFFLRALTHQFRSPKGLYPFGNYYEFGVGEGNTLSQYLKSVSMFCEQNNVSHDRLKIFAFDSFKGLPKSDLDEDNPKLGNDGDNSKLWSEGEFSCSVQEIKEKIKTLNIKNIPDITYVEGFFEKTLTDSLRDKLIKNPPAIINIDVDYYSSTKTILNWLRPILPSGTIFYFDDIWPFHGNPDYGELKAIKEFNDEDSGYLTPYPVLGMISYVYIYSKKNYE